jgi:predicted anti-sigma-YlaC factor YlaD
MDRIKECERSEGMSLLISLDLDGMLDADDRRHLESHLAACASCQAERAAMQAVSSLFVDAEMVGPPLGFSVRIERRLEEKALKRRRALGGAAMLTSSLSLVGLATAAMLLVVGAFVAWQWLGGMPAVQQGASAFSQIASGLGVLGKGTSIFLKDLLWRYGPAFMTILAVGLVVLSGAWIWLYTRRPRKTTTRRNGYA